MADNIDTNLADFWHALAGLPTTVQTNLGQVVIEAGQEAQATAPTRTGGLRSSVFARSIDGGREVVLGAAVRYAPYVFFGTRRMRANPFLQLALARSLRNLGPRLARQFGPQT